MANIDLALLERDNTEGVFSRYEIPRLLLTPVRRRLTGALKLVEGTAVRMIGFSNGSPTVAASSLAEERLGALLVARSVISAEQLAQIDESMKTQGLQFGAAATGLGFVTKAELAKWLREQHAWVVTRCVRAESQRSTFGPLGKLASARSGLPILRCIEEGIREYPAEELASLAQSLDSTRFELPPASIALAKELGSTPSISQLLDQAGQPHSFQELTVSTDDDDPTVPVLTLVLTRLAMPAEAQARPTGASAASPAIAGRGFVREDMTMPSVRSAFPPSTVTAETRVPSQATQDRVNEVDDLLSSLKNRPPLAESPRREPPAPPAPPVAPHEPAIAVELEAPPVRQPAIALAPPEPTPIPPPRPPPRSRSSVTPLPGDFLASASLGPGRPAEGGALTPDAISGPPSDLADMPAGSEGGRFDVGPVTSPSSEPVSLPPRRQTKPGISYGPDGVPTLPADSPYTVVRREMLSRLERPHKTGLPVLVGGGAGLLLLGVILGFGAARMTTPAFSEPASPPHASAPAPAPRAEAAAPAPAPTPEPAATTPATTPAPTSTPTPATAAEPHEPAPAATAAATPEKPAEESNPAATAAPRHATAARPKPAATRPAAPPPEPKPAAAAAPRPEPVKPVAGIPAKLAEVRKLLGLKDYRQVVVICADVLKEDPRNTTAYKSLGVAYSGLGARPQACESYRRYLRLAPDAPDKDQIEAILGACN